MQNKKDFLTPQSKKQEKTQQFMNPYIMTCRICLQDINCQQNQSTCPCACTGSLRFVHKQCLSLWIKKIINLKQKDCDQKMMDKIACQICKQWIRIQIKKVLRCRQKQQIEAKYIQNKINFFIMLSLLLINIVILGVCLDYLILNGFQKSNQYLTLNITIASGCFILGLVTIISFSVFIRTYFFISQLEVVEIKKNKEQNTQKITTQNTIFQVKQVKVEFSSIQIPQ